MRLHHRGVGEGRDVSHVAVLGDVAQEPTHDFAGSRLGEFGDDQDLARFGNRADLVRHVVAERLQQTRFTVFGSLSAAVSGITNATIPWPVVASVAPTTAASATDG